VNASENYPVTTGSYEFLLGVLGVWRITHLLNAEDGPGDLLVRFRRAVGQGFWGSLLDCFYCLSLWISVPFAVVLARSWQERILIWLAFSAGAILLERMSRAREGDSRSGFWEDENAQHGTKGEETGDK